MSDLELVLNMLVEATTTELSKTTNPQTFNENLENKIFEITSWKEVKEILEK